MYTDDELTYKVQEKIKKQPLRMIRCWKVLDYVGKRLIGPYTGKRYVRGNNHSNRQTTTYGNIVNTGVHVYLTRGGARDENRWVGGAIIPCWCKAKDFVAAGRYAGGNRAVFLSIYIDPEDYDKAQKGT